MCDFPGSEGVAPRYWTCVDWTAKEAKEDEGILSVEKTRARDRKAAQILIEEIGADGPMNVDDVAEKAVEIIQRLRKSVNTLETQLEESLEERDMDRVDAETARLPKSQGS